MGGELHFPVQNGRPRWISSTGAVVVFGKRTRKPNSVYAVIPLGGALPLALISDLPGGFGHCMEQPCGAGPAPGTGLAPWPLLPSLFGLAPCGVYPATAITGCAVRSYRTISPLPLRGAALWTSPSGVPGCPPKGGVAEAVCFLWHWPSTGLNARVPDVIRHTALRSSDFPLPAILACAKVSGSDRPVLLPVSSLPRVMKPWIGC